jgi:hypothetical protein
MRDYLQNENLRCDICFEIYGDLNGQRVRSMLKSYCCYGLTEHKVYGICIFIQSYAETVLLLR